MFRMSDRQLKIVAPIMVKQACETPNRHLEDCVAELRVLAARRGLRSVLADMDRVAAGGSLELPAPPEGLAKPGEALAVV